MKLSSWIATAALAFAVSTAARAAPITYEGILMSGVPMTGSVGGLSWFLEDVSQGIDFWSFSAPANSLVTIQGTRLNDNLDPAFSLYFGITTADASLFAAEANWGGLQFLASADDEIPRPFHGGDPFLANFLTTTGGVHTIAIGGSLSTDAGQYPYRIQVTVAPIPEPETALLALGGLLVLSLAGRRRSTR